MSKKPNLSALFDLETALLLSPGNKAQALNARGELCIVVAEKQYTIDERRYSEYDPDSEYYALDVKVILNRFILKNGTCLPVDTYYALWPDDNDTVWNPIGYTPLS